MNDELILGAEGKICVKIDPIGAHNAYEFYFDIELYTNPKKRIIKSKYDCIPIEGNDYAFYVAFDTKEVGIGDLTAEIVAYIPDDCFEDGLRTERIRIESITTIIP